ncbi:hypothetical protein HY972_01350 [Candidatus Kaiserbacteria bacterium]|nr:hypothetical protein [Candidatus Kaiserbacteria bacterium]
MGRHRNRPPKTSHGTLKDLRVQANPEDRSTWTAEYAKKRRNQTNDVLEWRRLDSVYHAILTYEGRMPGSELRHPFSGAYRPKEDPLEKEHLLDLLGDAHAIASPA